jgi:hypothetical protein
MGGGHPTKRMAIPLLMMNRPIIATTFFIEHSSPDLSPFLSPRSEKIPFIIRKDLKKEKKNVLTFVNKMLTMRNLTITSGGNAWLPKN